MIDFIILVGIVALLYYKVTNPQVKWLCLIGVHDYKYSYEKHGMYIDDDSINVVGTKRKVYTCSCGNEKPPEDVDWIK